MVVEACQPQNGSQYIYFQCRRSALGGLFTHGHLLKL